MMRKRSAVAAAAAVAVAGGTRQSPFLVSVAAAVISDPLAGPAQRTHTRLRRPDTTSAKFGKTGGETMARSGDNASSSSNRGEGAPTGGRAELTDRLSALVFSGSRLEEEERTLAHGDPTLADLHEADGEISEYYWRQLRYASSASMLYQPLLEDDEDSSDEFIDSSGSTKPAPKKFLPSEITCTAPVKGRGEWKDCEDKIHKVVIEFRYNVECTGFVSESDWNALDHALLREAAEGECLNSEYRWEDDSRRRFDRLRRLDSISSLDSIGAGPNSVVDILLLLDDEEPAAADDDDQSRRKLEIVSIGADPEDVRSGRCKPTSEAAKRANCCQERTGFITVTYNECGDNSSKGAVIANVLRKIKDAMEKSGSGRGGGSIFQGGGGSSIFQGGGSSSVFQGGDGSSSNGGGGSSIFQDGEGSNVLGGDGSGSGSSSSSSSSNVEKVVYVGPDINPPSLPVYSTSQMQVSADGNGLSPGQKAAIAIASLILALLALLALLAIRRRAAAGKDSRSVKTDMLDGDSYITADYGDLGGHHSKLDVHKCKSALCKGCASNRPDLCYQNQRACPPVIEEESSEIVRDLAAIKDRPVVFLRTQGQAPGQFAEHVELDVSSDTAASSSLDSIDDSDLPKPPPPEDGPTYVEQEELAASLHVNGAGCASQARII